MKGEHSMRSFLLALAGALVVAAPASAGGWATAGLAPPEGISSGDTWNAIVTIKQHGTTPLVGVQPAVIITKGGETQRFPAEPTGTPGVYAAKVKFPSGGTWNYAVYDGFTQYGGAKLHTFAPVAVAGGTSDGGLSIPAWTWILVAAALALGTVFLLARRARPAHAPVAQP